MSPPDPAASIEALKALADHPSMSVMSCALDGTIDYVNQAAVDRLGLDVGDSVFQAFAPHAMPMVRSAVSDIHRLDSVLDVELPLVKSDGAVEGFRIMLLPRRDDAGDVAGYVAAFMDVQRDSELEDELHHRVNHDPLTDCLTRAAVGEELENRLRSSAERVAVLYLDLDGFKMTNDDYGHAVGDQVLRVVARRLNACVRETDAIARLGGDEFLVITEAGPADNVLGLAHRLHQAITETINTDRVAVEQQVSIGVAIQTQESTAEQLISNADMAMYEAKKSEMAVSLATSSMRQRVDAVQAIHRDFLGAMDSGDIRFVYQPIRSLLTGELMGVESLVRWDHPELGMVPPPELISRAEASGQIDVFTLWSLETIARDWSALRARWPFLALKAVSLNLSPRQLSMTNYVEHHVEALDRYGLRRADIIVEVIESGEIEMGLPAERAVRRLGEEGVPLALDDFGVGYNALSYFTRFPMDALKVDRSLVSAVTHDRAARVILENVMNIARQLELVAVAEGIETEEEAQWCRRLGFQHGQGYLLGRPMELSKLAAVEMAGEAWTPHLNAAGEPVVETL